MFGRRQGSWAHRLVAAVLAVWFAVVTADPMILHACPMHDGVAAADMTGAGIPGAGMAMPDESGSVGTAVAETTAHRDGAPSHGTNHLCTCLGQCCAAASLFAPTPPTIDIAAALSTPAQLTGRPAHEYVAGWVDFVLPFATAPPIRAVA